MRLGAILLLQVAMPAWAADATLRPALSYSTAFGGSGEDRAAAVAADAAGNAYVAGTTMSPDFPMRNGFQTRMGGIPLRASTDGGKTWTAPDIAPGVNSIAGSAGALYAGTAAGIYKSGDSGKTWMALPSAPPGQTGAVVVDAANPETVYAATDRGVFKSMDAGASWNPSNQGLPNPSNYPQPNLVAHPSRPATLFATFDYSLYRSLDAGANWTRLDGMAEEVISLAFDPDNPDTLYAGTSGTGIYRTLDGGESWRKLADIQVSFSRGAIAVSATAVYAATGKGVMRSTDGGLRWTATSITAPADVVATDPNHPQAAYAAADTTYVSTDGGAGWSVLVATPAHSVASIAIAGGTQFIGSVLPQNIFVTKWSPDGKQILYSTYLGGSYYDYATGITVDQDGNAYVTGFTYSADFPTTHGAFQGKSAGRYSAFVAKIGADGSKLLYSTLLGGSGGDSANAIAIDAAGNAYVTGYTGSVDFPVTPGAFATTLQQGCASSTTEGDAFVSKLDAKGQTLLFSTYLGGACADQGTGIAVDSPGGVYVAGITSSPDFPVTKGALTATYSGVVNSGFVAKLTPPGDKLEYSTFLGAGWGDTAQAVAVDDQGNAYVTGSSFGLDQPGPAFGSGEYEVAGSPVIVGMGGAGFVLKLSPAGAKLYSTAIGMCMTTGTSIAVDSAGRAWIAGATGIPPSSADGFFLHNCIAPTVPAVHPFQGLSLGWGFVSELSADGASVLFSSLLDFESGLALSSAGNAFVVGVTDRTDGSKRPDSALLLGIDGSVNDPVTIEEPHSEAVTPHMNYTVGFGYPAVVAPGSVVVLPGTGLGPDREVRSPVTPGGTLATVLSGTSVTFDGIAAPLISVQAQQVVCIAPFELAGRDTAVVEVQNGSTLSNAIRVPVTPTAVAVLAVANQDGSPNSTDHPAAPGSVISIYVAGLGPTNPQAADGAINGVGGAAPKAAINVLVNGWLAGDILYYGPAPGQPAGISQVNFRIPLTIPGIGAWPARQYNLVVGTGDQNFGDYDVAQLAIR